MATKSSISKQAFEELLEEQKGQEILKWAELEEGQIYEIVNYEFIDTRNGKSCVITLSDGTRVWSPLALTNRLKKLDPEDMTCILYSLPQISNLKYRGVYFIFTPNLQKIKLKNQF